MPVDNSAAPLQLTFFANAESPSWSPDGKELAFSSNEGGKQRVWAVSAAGGPPRVFGGTEVSVETNLAHSPVSWGPRGTILYQRPGNRVFTALDPATQRESPVVGNDSLGWVFAATHSPDGTRVAVYWNRPPERGIWIVPAADGAGQKVYDGYHMPAGWAPDGTRVFALDRSDPARLISIPLSGEKPQELTVLPWSANDELNCTTRDGQRFVCAVTHSVSDVWLATHFDPVSR